MFQEKREPVFWYNVPITRSDTTNTKKVRWSDQLTQVKTISPRYKSSPFTFPKKQNCVHFSCLVGQPCQQVGSLVVSQDPSLTRSLTKTSLDCSPQLQKVVFKAVNNSQNQRKLDRNNLSLNLGNKYSSYNSGRFETSI